MITFKDGSRHITPGVPKPVSKPKPNDGYYVGQWMRDGFYGISNGWGLVNESVHQTFFKDAEFALAHARADGVLPQFCPPTGPCGYGQNCNDTVGAPDWQGCQDLDSCAFGVKWAAHIWTHVPPEQASAFFKKWLPTLLRGMTATTKSPSGSGLLWSNTSRPMVGYGFQDGEWKSGDVLYSNVPTPPNISLDPVSFPIHRLIWRSRCSTGTQRASSARWPPSRATPRPPPRWRARPMQCAPP